jgi:hypothetical protein
VVCKSALFGCVFPKVTTFLLFFLWVTVVFAQRGCNLCSIQSYCNQTSLQKVIDSLVILECKEMTTVFTE